jgi:hypothetical protein
MAIKEKLSNLFCNYQNLSSFSAFNGSKQSNTQKIIKVYIKNDCVYHKYWYEPVNNGSSEPKHIQIDRCTFGLLATEGCNTECASYTPVNQEDECCETS